MKAFLIQYQVDDLVFFDLWDFLWVNRPLRNIIQLDWIGSVLLRAASLKIWCLFWLIIRIKGLEIPQNLDIHRNIYVIFYCVDAVLNTQIDLSSSLMLMHIILSANDTTGHF